MIATTACERFDTPAPGALVTIELSDLSGIPEDYGELVGIITHADYAGWAQLWFEDQDKTIRVVRVYTPANRMLTDVLVIPRN